MMDVRVINVYDRVLGLDICECVGCEGVNVCDCVLAVDVCWC